VPISVAQTEKFRRIIMKVVSRVNSRPDNTMWLLWTQKWLLGVSKGSTVVFWFLNVFRLSARIWSIESLYLRGFMPTLLEYRLPLACYLQRGIYRRL
jgi:hypothetical protein